MRVVHLTPYFAPAFVYGGPPRSVLGLCRGLQLADADVAVVTTTANGASELPPAVTARGTFEQVPVTYVARSFPKRHFAAAGLERVLDAHRGAYDLVHLHGCWNLFGWAAARWCRRAGVPYVISPRGMLHPWSFAHGRAAKWLGYRLQEARVLRGARFVHATSVEEADVIAKLGLSAKVVIVSNGVDRVDPLPAGSTDAFRARFGVAPGDFVALFLGRLHPKKGLDTLIEAFRLIAAKHLNARLLVAGGGEPRYIDSLKDATRDLRQTGRVIFTGFLDGEDRPLALESADAFVLTSHSENFGLSVAEAMAAARPVVVSRACPWPQIDDWRAGLWIENTPAAIAAALDTLISNPCAARTMGQNGRRAVRQHLDWKPLAEQMLDVYRHAIAKQ